ncbi:MAG: hypothetical protein IJ566_05070 [Cardiobacteriaceae bacterium]|nr:hypothetical protein [Cardiobacteriaceae bacterium]
MSNIAVHSAQEISAMYGQLSDDNKQKIYQFLNELLSLPETELAEEISTSNNQTIYEFCKNCDPRLADIELEITPRKEQLSRRDFDFE